MMFTFVRQQDAHVILRVSDETSQHAAECLNLFVALRDFGA